eukprot:UN05804
MSKYHSQSANMSKESSGKGDPSGDIYPTNSNVFNYTSTSGNYGNTSSKGHEHLTSTSGNYGNTSRLTESLYNTYDSERDMGISDTDDSDTQGVESSIFSTVSSMKKIQTCQTDSELIP